ncbi:MULTISPECIES: polyprenyl synthetase family protein [Pontibacillus]|uniref:Polyprenyl synthetase family protein n=1 Tax=Pontibacillus chungwhensis TaxID=265426 RepID=A0ABY8V3H2_9BACI|nr:MULTISPECIES: polyprenyl synthetase family protein [Pontibacillus]MCD5324314.1 polyprenyl synthetase family protein [Pontibacillus sp. HN14]WIF99389.1 polyprenyl synthetase family protein [Pontibacillus chungwhensis]
MDELRDEEIGERMLEALQKESKDDSFMELLHTFVQSKQQEGFSFAKMVYLHYLLFGGKDRSVVLQGAAGMEAFILGLDILDDLEDQDGSERDWMEQQALSMNGSTGLILAAVKMVGEVDSTGQAVAQLSQFGIGAVTGQHHDLLGDLQSEEAYIQMVERKSGSLMALACQLGTILAKGEYDSRVKGYGVEFGCTAQLANDLEDALRLDQTNDILHKKRTLPVLKLLEEEGPFSDRLRQYYEGAIGQDEFLKRKQETFQFVSQSTALTYSRVKKRVWQLSAIDGVKKVDGDEAVKARLVAFMERI